MAIPAANRQTGRRNDSNMVKSLIQVDLPAPLARSPGASSGTSSGFRRGYQDAPYHHPAAGMPSISPGAAIPSSPERSVPASSPGAASGYELSESSWQARSHKDYEAPRKSVYGNQYAEAEGRDRMYNSRNSPLPGNDCGHKVGPLDRQPLDSPDQVLAPSSKTSCLAQLGKSSHDGYAAEENHRRGKSDMYSAHLTNAYRPKVTNVLEENPEASWVKRKTAVVSPQKGAWTKVSPPKQEKVPQYQDTLRTLHRTSLEPQPDAAVKRGEHRKAPLQRFAAATPETPATDALETPAAAEDLSH